MESRMISPELMITSASIAPRRGFAASSSTTRSTSRATSSAFASPSFCTLIAYAGRPFTRTRNSSSGTS